MQQRAALVGWDVRPQAAGSEPAVPGRLPAEWGVRARAAWGAWARAVQAERPEVPAVSDVPARRQAAASVARGPRAGAARDAEPLPEAVPDAVRRPAVPDAPGRPVWGAP